MRKKYKTLSRTSPKGGQRACLCKDSNTYSLKCCDGSLWAQGIGKTQGESLNGKWYGYRIENCVDQHHHNVHVHDTPLEVGKTYYFTLQNNHNACYTVVESRHSEGIHVDSVSVAYDNCVDCQAEN
jgi:hypothetical protein